MELLFTVPILIGCAFGFIYLGKILKVPSTVSLMAMGLVINIPYVKNILLEGHLNSLEILGDIGLIGLMFITGIKSSQEQIIKEKKDAIMIAISAALVSFLFGFVTFMFLGYSLLISLLVGVCVCVTAEATTAEVLLETRKLRTRVGAAMIGSGVVDDILGFGLFASITYFLKESYIRDDLLIAAVIFFFFLGVYLSKHIPQKQISQFEKVASILIIPFFFISIGINFDFKTIVFSPLTLLIIFAVGFIGKVFGTFLVKSLTRFNWQKIHLIAWAMNCRGGVGLAFALIAFRGDLIPLDIYSALILLALATNISFPFIMRYYLKKNKDIMD